MALRNLLISLTSSDGNKEKKCDCAGPSEICDVNKDWSHKYKDKEHQGPKPSRTRITSRAILPWSRTSPTIF